MSSSTRPLAGRRIVVTRARTRARDLSDGLEELGATVIELPAIEIHSVDAEQLGAVAGRLTSYEWLVFTSANAVDVLLDGCSVDPSALSTQTRIAAVGKSTERRLRDLGFPVDLIPPRFVAESLVEEMIERGVGGARVLVPTADIARDTVVVGLAEAGAIVDRVTVYRTVRPESGPDDAIKAIHNREVDMITFASPSAVRNAVELLGGQIPEGIGIASIGPVTTRAVHELGLGVDVEASEHSANGMVVAIGGYWAQRGS